MPNDLDRPLFRWPDGSLRPVIAGGSDVIDPEPPDPPENDPEPPDDPEVDPEPVPAPEPPAPAKEPFDEERALRTIRKQRDAEKKLKAERDRVKAERDALLAEKETEQERTTRLLEETKAENERLRAAGESATISAALRDIAIERDIDPKRVGKVIRLIDRSDISVEDGEVIGAEDAVDTFLEDYPEFAPKPADPEPEPTEDDDPPEPRPKRGANPDRKRSSGGKMSHKEAVQLSTREPEKFAELLAEGKIPRSALGGSDYDKLKSEGRLSTVEAAGA